MGSNFHEKGVEKGEKTLSRRKTKKSIGERDSTRHLFVEKETVKKMKTNGNCKKEGKQSKGHLCWTDL